MKVMESFCHAQYLKYHGVILNDELLCSRGWQTYEMKTIGFGILLHVLHDLTLGHPVHNNLRWIDCGAKAADNVRMF